MTNTNETYRAKKGGELGVNGEFYKGGTFLPATKSPKQTQVKVKYDKKRYKQYPEWRLDHILEAIKGTEKNIKDLKELNTLHGQDVHPDRVEDLLFHQFTQLNESIVDITFKHYMSYSIKECLKNELEAIKKAVFANDYKHLIKKDW